MKLSGKSERDYTGLHARYLLQALFIVYLLLAKPPEAWVLLERPPDSKYSRVIRADRHMRPGSATNVISQLFGFDPRFGVRGYLP